MPETKKRRKTNKGTPFERTVAVQLSIWWTKGERSDVFWRTGGSGGRAKRRGRKGEETINQHGDIFATHAVGQPLIDAFTLELKKGYNRETLANLIDRPRKKKEASAPSKDTYTGWIAQVTESAKQAGSRSWGIIHKRDNREATITLPLDARIDLSGVGKYLIASVEVSGIVYKVIQVSFEDFLRHVSSEDIVNFLKRSAK